MKLSRLQRGMSLIEGMISMAVVVIGITGAFVGILHASRQNSVASRMARAASMAAQVRQGLEAQGRTNLVAALGMIGGACTPVGSAPAALRALTDGLDGIGIPGTCLVDVDAWDTVNNGTPALMLVPEYDFAEDYHGGPGPFRRVIVYVPGNGGVDTFAVVVAVRDLGRWIFVKQFVGLYNSTSATGNGALVDI